MPGRRALSAHFSVVVALLTFALCGAGVAAAAAASPPPPSDGSWLLEHTAQRATIGPVGHHGSMVLTLTGTSAMVRALAQGHPQPFDFQTVDDFVKSWHTYGFDRMSPAAAIVTGGRALLVKLSNPHTGPHGTLRYIAEPLRGATPSHLREFARESGSSLPRHLGPTSLYLADPNPERIPVELTIKTANLGWEGSFSLASPAIHSLQSKETPVVAQTEGSTVALTVYAANVTDTLVLLGDPLGNCLMVTLETSYEETIGAAIRNFFSLQPGLNGLPIQEGAGKCPDERMPL